MDYEQTTYVFKQVRKAEKLKPRKRTNKGSVKRLSAEEISQFLRAAYSLHPKTGLMMTTLYETAARVSEFAKLEVSDLYRDDQRIIIRSGKGGKRREIPITQELVDKLQLYINQRKSGPLFMTIRDSAYSPRTIQHMVKQVALTARLNARVSPHILRHTRATLLAEAGMSKDHLQIFLGHQKAETTQIYTHTAAVDMKQAFLKATKNQP